MQHIQKLTGIINLERTPEQSLQESVDRTCIGFNKKDEAPFKGANQVLLHNNGMENTIYIPVYLRIKVNRVIGINYIEARAELETELRIWILLKQFPKQVQDDILQKASFKVNDEKFPLLSLLINDQENTNGNSIKNISQYAIQLKLNKNIGIDIENNPFWSPFQLINLVAYVHMEKIQLRCNYEELDTPDRILFEKAAVKFNFIDAHSFLQFSFGELRHLGVFDLAENLVDMEFATTPYSDTSFSMPDAEEEALLGLQLGAKVLNLSQVIRKQQIHKQEFVPESFSYGRILIPLYRYPGATIVNVFLPFYILSFLSLGVFFEKPDMTNRSASIATYQIAFIAFFPTIRASLPETPNVVFAQILISIQALSAIICFGESLYHNQDQFYEFLWKENVPFLICLTFTFINLCVIILLFIIHKCIWEPRYNSLPPGSDEFIGKKWINTDEWWSEECQKGFEDSIRQGLVKPLFQIKRPRISEKRKATMIANQRNKSKKFDSLKRSKLL